jgi:hypothetical protein
MNSAAEVTAKVHAVRYLAVIGFSLKVSSH